jgi:hypothetical protein
MQLSNFFDFVKSMHSQDYMIRKAGIKAHRARPPAKKGYLLATATYGCVEKCETKAPRIQHPAKRFSPCYLHILY